MMKDRLTLSSLLHLLRHNQKDSKYLNHYLHHDVLHSICRRNLDIFLESSEEILDTPEDIDERVLTCHDVLCRLCRFGIRRARGMGIRDHSYRKEDTSASENDIRGREHLET